MAKQIVLLGQRFGRLVVTDFAGRRKSGKRKILLWECRCDCGHTAIVPAESLSSGNTRSCGCLRDEIIVQPRKHGMVHSLEYLAWANMIQRCTNPKATRYNRYGGRGIGVCKEWKKSFLSFLLHVGRMPAPDYTIGRMNNDRGYEPGNVGWVTKREQAANKSNSAKITYDGRTETIAEWSRITGIKASTLYYRLSHSWPAEKILGLLPVMGGYREFIM
jgi:hypothetical protein